MSELRRCRECGGNSIQAGDLVGLASVKFQPHERSFWSFPGGVSVEAAMCGDCGTITLKGNVPRLQRIVPAPQQAAG